LSRRRLGSERRTDHFIEKSHLQVLLEDHHAASRRKLPGNSVRRVRQLKSAKTLSSVRGPSFPRVAGAPDGRPMISRLQQRRQSTWGQEASFDVTPIHHPIRTSACGEQRGLPCRSRYNTVIAAIVPAHARGMS
jgi:hypothetical protein